MENIVITSHTSLKKHFLNVEIDKLVEKFRHANIKFIQLKENFDSKKALYHQQLSEKYCLGIHTSLAINNFLMLIVFQFYYLEGQAGLLTNLPMLRDFKQTEEDVKCYERSNAKMKRRLRNWWEG